MHVCFLSQRSLSKLNAHTFKVGSQARPAEFCKAGLLVFPAAIRLVPMLFSPVRLLDSVQAIDSSLVASSASAVETFCVCFSIFCKFLASTLLGLIFSKQL
jgi:hypothetical protein